jgi:alpha-galactosidase
MENPSDNIDANRAGTLEIARSGLRFIYQQAGGRLYGGRLLPLSHEAEKIPHQGITACRPFELILSGEGPNFAARSRSIGGCASLMRFKGMAEERRADGLHVTLGYERAEPALTVTQHFLFPREDIPVCRQWICIKNDSPEPLGVEQLASAVMHHVGVENGPDAARDLRLHIPFSGWSGEGQWRELSPSELGLTSSDSSHYRAVSIGSRASAEKNPMAVLVDTKRRISWFWQIEHSGSWMWEIGNLFYKEHQGLYWLAGGPNEPFGGWWKELAPGESFETVPVALGCVDGGFEEAVGALTAYRRAACRRPHPVDDRLPVIFNDYMHCLWGDPTLEKELPLIRAAAKLGCEIFAMDSGWYAAPDENWWPGVGEWKVNEARFPGDAFGRVMREIRDHGMIPGLWLEPEVVGVRSPVSARPDGWFLRRHGRRVAYNGRFFLDFRNPEVREWMLDINTRLINNYGIGYIKYDYNIDLMQGVDSVSGGLGHGLLEHARALYQFYEGLAARFPELIMENCGAGGLRMDYGMLSRMQIQSSSDLENCLDYAPLAAGVAAVCLPEQMAVWAYPSPNGGEEDTILNMVNSLLGRVHLSGRIDLLSAPQLLLVREALDLYKQLRGRLVRMRPFYPSGMPSIMPRGVWMSWGMRNEAAALLGVWRRGAAEKRYEITLPAAMRSWQARILYPQKSSSGDHLEHTTDGRLIIQIGHPVGARLVEISAP